MASNEIKDSIDCKLLRPSTRGKQARTTIFLHITLQ